MYLVGADDIFADSVQWVYIGLSMEYLGLWNLRKHFFETINLPLKVTKIMVSNWRGLSMAPIPITFGYFSPINQKRRVKVKRFVQGWHSENLSRIRVNLYQHFPLALPALSSDYIFDLILSGHTHGGQYFPYNFFIWVGNPFYRSEWAEHFMCLFIARWSPENHILTFCHQRAIQRSRTKWKVASLRHWRFCVLGKSFQIGVHNGNFKTYPDQIILTIKNNRHFYHSVVPPVFSRRSFLSSFVVVLC